MSSPTTQKLSPFFMAVGLNLDLFPSPSAECMHMMREQFAGKARALLGPSLDAAGCEENLLAALNFVDLDHDGKDAAGKAK